MMTKQTKKIEEDKLDFIRDQIRQNRILSAAVRNVDLESEDDEKLIAVFLISRTMTEREKDALQDFQKQNPIFSYAVRDLQISRL